jgi:hypothetical protein
MKSKNIRIAAVLLLGIVSRTALADPCTVESSKDDLSTSSTLRYVVEEFLNARTDKPCSASGYEDGEYFAQSVGFLTDEANTSSKAEVNLIEFGSVLEFDMEYAAVIGNVSQDALDDVETTHDSDVAYDGDGNEGDDGDSYTVSGGEVKDYGMVVIDARSLGENVNPFSCSSDSADVYLRNMIILTDSVTIGEVFDGCVKDGGNAWVCAYDYKEDSDPRVDSDWCTRSWIIAPFPKGTLLLSRRWYADEDGDGYGDPDDSIVTWPGDDGYDEGRDGYTTRDHSDCDDGDAAVNPAAAEICDGIDNNCDEVIDTDAVDQTTWYRDADDDAYGDANASQSSCDQAEGYVEDDTDCDDTDAALTTDCSAANGESDCSDGVDNDGNGQTDCDDAVCADHATCLNATLYYFWFRDADDDGYGDPSNSTAAETQPEGYVGNAGDCDDTDPNRTFDCSGDTGTWYADRDADGYGNWFDAMTSETQPDGYVENAGDCDDTDAERTTDCRISAEGDESVDPDVSPDTDAGTSGFNGQLEGSVFSGGSCQLHTTDQGAPSGFLPLMMVLASLVILPVRARLKNK